MFDDPKKELERLERQLLDGEENRWLDDQLAEAHRLLGDPVPEEEPQPEAPYYRGSHIPRRSRNTDPADVDMDSYSDEIHDEPKKKGVRGLVILICLELLGIAAVAAYWLLVLL